MKYNPNALPEYIENLESPFFIGMKNDKKETIIRLKILPMQ
jgi:hypothetical protein